jgi:hypothetical protein
MIYKDSLYWVCGWEFNAWTTARVASAQIQHRRPYHGHAFGSKSCFYRIDGSFDLRRTLNRGGFFL